MLISFFFGFSLIYTYTNDQLGPTHSWVSGVGTLVSYISGSPTLKQQLGAFYCALIRSTNVHDNLLKEQKPNHLTLRSVS